MLQTMHPEDIKAAIRKRFGTMRAFEKQHGLPDKSVAEVLRGRRSRRVESAINDVLNTGSPSQDTEHSDASSIDADAHGLNAEADLDAAAVRRQTAAAV